MRIAGCFAFLRSGRFWRRSSQLLVLVAFLALFRATEDPGDAAGIWILHQANWFFRLDPLVGATVSASIATTGTVVWNVVLPALAVLLTTMVLARWFCGWFCPLGTLIDLSARVLRPLTRIIHRTTDSPQLRSQPWMHGLRRSKYVLLIAVLVTAACGLPLIGFVDPFAILTRGLAVGVDPALNAGAESGSSWLLDHTPTWFSTNVSEPTYAFAKAHLLPTRTGIMHFAAVSALLLGIVLLLELVQKRFWCRNLCPTGALLGLAARFSWLKRMPVKSCANCQECSTTCRMAAFDQHLRFQPEACNLCMDCSGDCPKNIAKFTVVPPVLSSAVTLKKRPAPAPLDLSRRAFLITASAGAAAPLVVSVLPGLQRPSQLPRTLLRPPGAIVGAPLEPPPVHIGVTLPAANQPSDGPETRPFLERLPATTKPAAQSEAIARDRHFLDLCVRCGECMKVCPTGALQPGGFSAGIAGVFAPVLAPQNGYCEYSCTLCAQVCPTHAIPLTTLVEKQRAVIGQAVFDRERCLPHAKHEECVCCEEHCPVPDKAIRLEKITVTVKGETKELGMPFIVAERCIGCGICENKCPLEDERGIRVIRV